MSAPVWPGDLEADTVDAVRRLNRRPDMERHEAMAWACRLVLAIEAGLLRLMDDAEYQAVRTVVEAAKRGDLVPAEPRGGRGFDA